MDNALEVQNMAPFFSILILVLFFWIPITLNIYLAGKKNRSKWIWGLYGMASYGTTIILALLPARKPGKIGVLSLELVFFLFSFIGGIFIMFYRESKIKDMEMRYSEIQKLEFEGEQRPAAHVPSGAGVDGSN